MFQGSMVALVTPMHTDGSIDEPALAELVEFHIDSKTDAIVAVGTTGESSTLTIPEHLHVVKRIIDIVNKRIPVIAGTGGNATYEAIELTQKACDLGADACLLVTPYYNKPTQEGLYQHFKAVADAVAVPQILYNVPGRTALDMLPATTARLSSIDNIIGTKEAFGTVERIKELVQLCAEDFIVLTGDDSTAMESMLVGCKGNISVTANVVPAEMHNMCMAAISGDRVAAQAIEARISDLHSVLFCESNPIPVKWALEKMGRIQSGIRLPLTTLAPEFHERVAAALEKANVLEAMEA